MPTDHVITIKFHISTDVDAGAGILDPTVVASHREQYLLSVGQSIIDGIPKDWFEPTEEYLHITGADIQVPTPFFQQGTREEIAQYLTSYVEHELSCGRGAGSLYWLRKWLEQGLEAFEEGAR